jgi:glutaredoxin
MELRKRTRSSRRLRLLSFLIAVGLSFVAPLLEATDVYKWKDADGKTHLSDRPPADYDAERMQVRGSAPADDASSGPNASASPVVMLSAAWCDVCKEARRWLTQNGVAFTEYDVERDRHGMEEYKRLKGKGIPIILVGDQRMDGFSASRLRAMLANVAK